MQFLSPSRIKINFGSMSQKKHIKAAEEWDRDDIASGAIKAAEQAAIDAGITFVHAGTVEAYQCKCGKVISLMDFIRRWLRNIRDKGRCRKRR